MVGNAARLGVLATAFVALPAWGEQPARQLPTRYEQLLKRLEVLAKRNAELEQAVKAQAAVHVRDIAERVRALEERNADLDAALRDEGVSAKEPELAARLKAVEYEALDIQQRTKAIDSVEGLSAAANFTTVAQRAAGLHDEGTQLNYRADISVTAPTIRTGDVESRVFAHFRVGQGKGLSDKFTSFVGPNATSFQLGSLVQPEASAMMLGEIWYEADIPLPLGGFKPYSRETLSINFGKMDPFAFFDQNVAANDETHQFLASVFTHNALLDNPLAANVGADGFGFSPGIRVSYFNERAKPENYRLSLGVFGAGKAASFSDAFDATFTIVQVETSRRFFGGLAGNYRLYVWSNGAAPTFVKDQTAFHTGAGISFDQRFGDGVVLFGRLGAGEGKRLPFDRTISLGAELNGSYWERGADVLGFAVAGNRTSSDFRSQSASVDADHNGIPDYGFAARGWEWAAEVYYRYRVHRQFDLSPDFQYIRDPAGQPDRVVKIFGLRANLAL